MNSSARNVNEILEVIHTVFEVFAAHQKGEKLITRENQLDLLKVALIRVGELSEIKGQRKSARALRALVIEWDQFFDKEVAAAR